MTAKSIAEWMTFINQVEPTWAHDHREYLLIDNEVFQVSVYTEGNFSMPVGTGTSRLEDYDYITVCIREYRRSEYGEHRMLPQAIYVSRSKEFKNYQWNTFWTRNSPNGKVTPNDLCQILKDIDQLYRLRACR